MNKLVIPSILTAAVLIAGMFAFMPIDKASTVHTTIIASNKAGGVDTIVLADPVTIEAVQDRYVLLDLHSRVATDGGFVVIRTTGVTVANLDLVVTDAAGVILGTADFTDLTGATFGAPAPHTQLLHAHIPSAANTVFVSLDATTGDVVLPADTTITTTLVTLQ